MNNLNNKTAMSLDDFLGECTACGGNWTAMFMSGIKAVAPEIYDAMPDRDYSFDEVCFICNHLCYDRPHLRFNLSIEGNIIEHNQDGTFVYRKATESERDMSMREFDRVYNGIQQ